MNKKGISPLIGTVLLVAIVIAMVLLVMPWVTNLVKQQQEKTTESTKQFDCITDLDLRLTSDATGAVILDNRGSVAINEVIFRTYSSTGQVTVDTMGDGTTTIVEAYGSASAVGGSGVITCPAEGRIEAIVTLGSGVVCSDMAVELTC